MFNHDEYKGYSLLHWYVDQKLDDVYGIIVMAQIRGEWKMLVDCSNINWFYDIMGIAVLSSAIVKCCQDPRNLYWHIAIDIDKQGKTEV